MSEIGLKKFVEKNFNESLGSKYLTKKFSEKIQRFSKKIGKFCQTNEDFNPFQLKNFPKLLQNIFDKDQDGYQRDLESKSIGFLRFECQRMMALLMDIGHHDHHHASVSISSCKLIRMTKWRKPFCLRWFLSVVEAAPSSGEDFLLLCKHASSFVNFNQDWSIVFEHTRSLHFNLIKRWTTMESDYEIQGHLCSSQNIAVPLSLRGRKSHCGILRGPWGWPVEWRLSHVAARDWPISQASLCC